MARDVSSHLYADLTAAVTAPGYLLRIDWSSPQGYCTRTSLTYAGMSFNERGFTVRGVLPSVDSSESANGTVSIHDPDSSVEQFVLNEGIEEKRIRLWAFSGDVGANSAIDLTNPVLLFDGYGAGAQVNPAAGSVQIQLQSAANRMSVAPRVRITKELGFLHLPVNGQEYEFGGEKWKA